MSLRIEASVVLCTFNGARHLPALLESVWRNGAAVAELLVVDDGSTDDTLSVLEAWQVRFGERMRVLRNAQRLGAAANFSAALAAARGGIVLPCDQDDVWRDDKVAYVLRLLATDPAAQVLQHDADLIDELGARLRGTMYRRLGLTMKAGEPLALFGMLLRRNRCPGCTLAIRREFLRCILPVPAGFMHDEWVALCAAAVGGLRLVPVRLIGYRLHAGNALGLAGLGPRVLVAEASAGAAERRSVKLGRLQVLRQKVRGSLPGVPPQMSALLEEAIAHRQARQVLPPRGWQRMAIVWRELKSGRYQRHASGVLSALADLLAQRRVGNH